MQSWLLNEQFGPRRDEDTYLFSLQELAVHLSGALDPHAILEHTVEWVAGLGVGAAMLEVHPGEKVLRLGATGGLTPQAVETLRAALAAPREEDTLAGQAVQLRQAIVVAEAAHDARFSDLYPYARAGAFQAAMAIPLVTDESCPTVLLIYAAAPGDLSATVTSMTDVASTIGSSVPDCPSLGRPTPPATPLSPS